MSTMGCTIQVRQPGKQEGRTPRTPSVCQRQHALSQSLQTEGAMPDVVKANASGNPIRVGCPRPSCCVDGVPWMKSLSTLPPGSCCHCSNICCGQRECPTHGGETYEPDVRTFVSCARYHLTRRKPNICSRLGKYEICKDSLILPFLADSNLSVTTPLLAQVHLQGAHDPQSIGFCPQNAP